MNIMSLSNIVSNFFDARRIAKRNKLMVADRRKGYTFKHIAELHGISSARVRQILLQKMGSDECRRYNWKKGETK